MSQTDIVTVLKIETGQSENTIKSIKKEISDLKKVLEGAEIGSEAFEKASRDLAAAQQQLKTVMDSTKKTVQAADGSYDALVATMAQLKKEWRATADEVKRNEIGKQIDSINIQLKELDASVGNHQRNVGNYKQDIVDAYREMGEGTINYGESLAELNKSTEASRGALDGVGKMASGVAGGFAALQGIMALCGKEGGNFEKVMVKITAAMAIAQGVGALKGLIEGYSQLKVAFAAASMGCKTFIGNLSGIKKAIMTTGIGVLVVAVGTLIAYWDDLTSAFGNSEDEIRGVKGVVDDLKASLENFDEDNNFIIRMAEAAGQTKEEILKLRLEQAKLAYEQAQAARDVASTNLKKAREDNWDLFGDGKRLTAAKEAYDETIKIENERWAALKKVYDDISVYEQEQRTNKGKEQKKYGNNGGGSGSSGNKEKEVAQQIAEEARKALIDTQEEELAEAERIYNEKKAKLEKFGYSTVELTEAYEKQKLEIITKYAEKQKAIDDKKAADTEKLQTNLLDSIKNSLSQISTNSSLAEKTTNTKFDEKSLVLDNNDTIGAIQLEIDKTLELQLIREQAFNEQMAQIQAVLDAEKERDLLTAEQEAELQKQYDTLQQEKVLATAEATNQINALNKQMIEQQKADNIELAQNITTTFTSALNAASNILSAVQEGIDTTNKEGFEKNKNLQIANATIQAIVGITTALAGAYTTKTGPWDIPLAYLQAATIAATTGIQIANIKKQTYDGSGSSGNLNGGVGVSPNISMADMIPINYTKDVLTDTETAELNKQNKVYVVEESDITETQRNVKVKEDNASF